MAKNLQTELIWKGRLHLGDEPGIYGDAHYSGIGIELPITVYRSDASETDDLPFTLILDTRDVATFQGYPGHEILVIAHEPDPANPYHSVDRILAQERLTSADNDRKEITVQSGKANGPIFLTVRLRVDTTVNPALYDDFVLTKLSFSAPNFTFFASFGFRNA